VLNITKYQQLNLVLNVTEVNRLLDKDRSNLLIIDARPFSEYSKGHIPSAVNIELMNFTGLILLRQAFWNLIDR